MSFNPKRLTGNFVICDDKFKARHGSKPFEFGPHQWGRIELWNAVEVMTPSFDLNVLLERMQHEDYTIRTQNHRIWMKKILEAILKSLGDKQFMYGEGSYNGPKIHAKTYKKGISLLELTTILVEHRKEASAWYAAKLAKSQEKAAEQVVEQVVEPVVEPVVVEEVKIVLEEVDDWEDLA